jgi:hypothetical protein
MLAADVPLADRSNMVHASTTITSSVGRAVVERVVFDNIRKFVLYLFSCNVAEVLVLLVAGIAGLPLPRLLLIMPLDLREWLVAGSCAALPAIAGQAIKIVRSRSGKVEAA